jgi:acetyl-CoA carboxylase carboxyl transferase subunit alpha
MTTTELTYDSILKDNRASSSWPARHSEARKKWKTQRTLLSRSAFEKVQLARHAGRPTGLDYILAMSPDFIELHGDRLYRDDPSVIGGIGTFKNQPITYIALQKGRSTEDNIYRNFAMAHPEGYRKALRLMKQAQKFNRPIITFIDTPGAYPGIGAEERGQAEAIATNLMAMSQLRVPILSIIIGEGGSGGALALAVANEVHMMEHAIYSVLSPEGFASILWKDASRAKEASELMRLTAQDLKTLEIVEHVYDEPTEGAHAFPFIVFDEVAFGISDFLEKYSKKSATYLLEQRYNKYRKIGVFEHHPPTRSTI